MRANFLKKFSWIVLALIMVLSNFFSFLPSTASAANADGSMTVSEAIANNSGTGTVEGYIVGHATGSLSANFQAPFTNDFNFLIADSSNEQNKAKLLDVQLPLTYRAQFGLQTNPGIIGKKIKVTGTLAAYNTFPGLKTPTALTFIDDSTLPPQTGVISIADAKKATGTVTIEGVVTADNAAIGGGKLSTFMQDSTGGINIFSSSPTGFPDLKEGDKIQVTGTITSYKELTEISPTVVKVTTQNQTVPAPVQVSLADLQDPAKAEQYEGQLVHMTGYFKVVPATPAGGGYNIQTVDQQFNGTTVRIIDGSIDMAAVQQDKWYDVTGILGQFTTYQVIPRKASDIVLSANQPPLYPNVPGDYEATVARVVDGDTIALQSPVLGATNVRFLNIDTPESDGYINLNGGVKTPVDQNQLDLGLAAKHYMETLLLPGDKVILKVGEEATDHYGRLLAQVVRQSDNLNTNLEMVNKGYAVTYFIWPIGHVDEYNMYQTAVKTAEDQALGIWNPANPLQELPFVFRARFSGEGLTRPVGNSDTKVYVDKEQWASVPVEKRIFFNTEVDAIANGYSKVGQIPIPPLPDGTGKKVLFDNTHGQTAGAADWVIDGAFSDFADGLRAAGFTVDALERSIPYTFGEQAVTYDKLKNFDVFIIGEANIPYKKSEQDAMLQYIKDGGSIFFIADHYNADRNKNRWDASEVMNGYRRGAWDNPAKGMSAEEAASAAMQGVQSSDWLAQNFGIRFRYNALGDVDNLTDVVTPDQSFGITAGVNSVAMHAGSTLAILDPTKAKGLVYVPTNVPAWANAVDSAIYNGGGRAEGPFSAVSKLGAGKAAFIGDSSPVEDATPKYLREENGAKKTTYDGFKGEANDAVYLVHTVEWLANHESYTSLTQVAGIQLDQPTQLLAYENPAQSTEPQSEPWAAPDAGYKWYDPSTFKPGSYGSTQQPPVQAQYNLVHQTTLPNAEQFQIRVTADNLLPGQSISGLTVGLYLPGGTQVAKFQNADGSWPTGYGYSASFSATADATGHAYKDLTVQINPAAVGPASLRLRVNGNNQITETVPIDNVPAEPLPKDHPPVPEKISIADARHMADNSLVTVEGIITSEPGAFGGQGFYVQDGTAGIYVFQSTAGYHAGDKISISAKKTAFNTELELTDPVVLEKIGTAALPEAVIQSALNDDSQGRLVKLENVTIQSYKTVSPAGSFEFDVLNGLSSTHVRVDVRTGISFNEFKTKFPEGSLVHITGISSIFKGIYQLKPLAIGAVELADIIAPTATIAYSTTAPTNQDVIATITPSEPVTITNNSGSTNYTFSENGSFTFEFIDAAGNKGTAIATVANIDKVAPTATVAYSTTASTNQDVTATITPSEAVTLTNNDGSTSYTFSENGSFTFEFIDAAGNKGNVTATVNNIDKIAPTLMLSVDKPVIEVNNHKMVPINVTILADGTGTDIASVVLTSITSNEPDNGLGDGDTVNDIQDAAIGTYDTSFSLRAERSGNGSGRIYTFTYIATDLAGNTTTTSTQVVVPKSKG
jgi:DNA/RNA endonuclease YhcR with UshA esterase domain/endonuclease YncB( thermonuclease family)